MGGLLMNFENRAANALGRIGERLGFDWLVYNPLRMHLFHVMAAPYAAPFADSLTEVFPSVRRMADVGSGSGVYAAACTKRGRPTIACERSVTGRLFARCQGVDCRPFDLTASPPVHMPEGIQLAYSVEVAEHLAAELGDRLVEFLCSIAPIVVFTAAPPGQGGTGHINEQPFDYWLQRFRAWDFELDSASTERFRAEILARAANAGVLAPNISVFRRLADWDGQPDTRRRWGGAIRP
jgi:hypothetical protein